MTAIKADWYLGTGRLLPQISVMMILLIIPLSDMKSSWEAENRTMCNILLICIAIIFLKTQRISENKLLTSLKLTLARHSRIMKTPRKFKSCHNYPVGYGNSKVFGLCPLNVSLFFLVIRAMKMPPILSSNAPWEVVKPRLISRVLKQMTQQLLPWAMLASSFLLHTATWMNQQQLKSKHEQT